MLAAFFVAGCATGEHPASLDAGVVGFDARPYDGRVLCTSDSQCGDRIACTVDHCRAGVCSHEACTDCCPAGLGCVPDFGCRTRPTPCTMDSECNDSIRCTLDRCRDATSCEHLPQPELCGAGDICLPAVGCIPEPPTMCTTAADCERGAMCVGEWSCQPEFGCQFISARDCDDADACTVDSCVEERGGCVHEPRDVDGDMHADATCAGGDDCADLDATRHPGATELCNGVDDDCDMMVDESCCVVGPCTTTCGTSGTRVCNPDGSEGACTPPAEACNGGDDDCDGMVDEGCCTAGACTTACGTAGVRGCNPDGTPGACMPPAEACNGLDDDCDGTADNGFACVLAASSPCTTSCGSTGSQTCGAGCALGACMPPTEVCNGTDDDCDGMRDDGFACVLGGALTSCTTTCGSTGTRACLPGCTLDSCAPPAETCNGVDDNCNAACDDGFTCCRGATAPCSTMGYFGGSAVCRADCSGYDVSTCTNCGNGTRNTGEACDGVDLGGATCTSIGMGFNGGTLRCGAGCMYDTSMCTRCGDGVRNATEQCDGMDLAMQTCATRGYTGGGTLRCSPSCAFDTSMCIWSPTGTWVVAPGVNYYCAFGAVSISFGALMFNDTGSALSVSGGGLNCMMTGASARVSRMMDVSCTLLGGCNETYRLVGTFTGDNTFTGTFTATFSGSGCWDCSSQTFSARTGTR